MSPWGGGGRKRRSCKADGGGVSRGGGPGAQEVSRGGLGEGTHSRWAGPEQSQGFTQSSAGLLGSKRRCVKWALLLPEGVVES